MESAPAPVLPCPSRRGGAPQSPRALLAHGLLLLGAAGAVFLAGEATQGSLGVFLMCAGLALVFCPPPVAVAGRLWLAGAGFILCCATAFLPAHWLPMPTWRATLLAAAVIPLPATITPAPGETAFWLGVVAISVTVGLFALSQPVRSAGLLALMLGAVGGCAGYAALAIFASLSGWHYPFASPDATFGFFANRNNTATFLITGSLLAVGTLGVTFRDRRWLSVDVAVGALVPCVAALFFFSSSRAGVLVLFLGVGLWMAGLGRRHRHPRLTWTVAVVLGLGIVGFLSVKSAARDRLLATVGLPTEAVPATVQAVHAGPAANLPGQTPAAEVPFDFRVQIYRDALRMVRDDPLTGTGLGTFALVFPQYRQHSFSEFAVLHPESDWLMAAAECGLPALGCLLALGAWVLAALWPWRIHPYWPLRWGCTVAALAGAIHGVFDAPAHHVALGWWLLVLAGLGAQAAPLARERWQGRGRLLQWAVFILVGLGALGLGGRLVAAQWFGAPPLPPFAAAVNQRQIYAVLRGGDAERAMHLADAEILRSPLHAGTYFLLADAYGQFEGTRTYMDENCHAQQVLDPTSTDGPLQQGSLWVDIDPQRTAGFWLEALARDRRIFQTTSGTPPVMLYADLIRRAGARAELQGLLWGETHGRPEYVFAWLENAPVALCRARIESLAADEGFLAQLTPEGRVRFVRDWEQRGDPATLQHFRVNHPGW